MKIREIHSLLFHFGEILKKGKLYIVPTPIGNLKDITYRAVEVLNEVDYIAAEDTRTSKILLKHYNISTQMISYHKYNEKKRSSELINFLNAGKDIAVISDAGTPGISDPSQIIIKESILHGIQVVPLPGATAFVPALIGSGLNTDNFMFVGFLPDKLKSKNELFLKIKSINSSLIFYESPHRIFSTLKLLKEIFGDRKVSIARELSKIYETFYRGNLSELIQTEIVEKGEFVIVLEGYKTTKMSDKEIIEKLSSLLEKGEKQSKAVKIISKTYDLPKNRVYELSLKLKES